MNGQLLAGTTRGAFVIDNAGSTQTLKARHVRDLVDLDGRVLAGSAAGLYTSEDGGHTWSGPQLEGREVWQIRAAPGGRLYASTEPAALFRSDDQGATWSEISSFAALPEAERWCVPVEPPQPGRARALVIDENDPDRIWVGVEVGGVARTTDGGQSWTVDLPGGNPDIHMMFAHPTEPGVLFISTGYGRFDGVARRARGQRRRVPIRRLRRDLGIRLEGRHVPRYSRPAVHRPSRPLQRHRCQRPHCVLALQGRRRGPCGPVPVGRPRPVVAFALRRRPTRRRPSIFMA